MKKVLSVLLCFCLLNISLPPASVLRGAEAYFETGITQKTEDHFVNLDIVWLLPQVIFPLWELPQNLIGLAVFFAMFFADGLRRIEIERGRFFIKTEFGLSLGLFVFWDDDFVLVNKKHEFGHAVQSQILGPLYLLVVGAPSVVRKQYFDWCSGGSDKYWPGYYSGFPEDWADYLGGIDPRLRL